MKGPPDAHHCDLAILWGKDKYDNPKALGRQCQDPACGNVFTLKGEPSNEAVLTGNGKGLKDNKAHKSRKEAGY